ncbi:MAG: Jag N-terminal domain-containing protein [Clostridia bacterium]|nr:Jag N-terminal domain-containing protein [Clostridia bacterium]
MVKEAIATGATIEEAQQAARNALFAPEDVAVQFEILEFPEKAKLFGLLGGKPAKVRAYFEAPDEPKPEPKKAPEKKPVKSQPKPQAEKKQEVSKKKEQKPVKKTQEKAAEQEKAPVEESKEKKEAKVVEKTPVDLNEAPETVKKAYAYLDTVIKGLGITDATINVSKAGKEYFFEVLSEQDYSLIIGRRGETLDSIQYLVRLAANHGRDEEKSVRISINVGDYREKREKTLKEIARKSARKVRKYGRNETLNPMNPAERRIIHTTISEIEGVVSYSVGSDSDRRVVIALAEGVKPLNSGNNRRGGNQRRGNGNRGGNRRPQQKPAAPAAPARAPRSDAAGTRYGKIEPIAKKPETTEE